MEVACCVRGYSMFGSDNPVSMKGTKVLTLSTHNLEKMMTTTYSYQ